jgi:hypothetical protein
VFWLHPDFNSPDLMIGSLKVPSFKERLGRVVEIESSLEAPFSVLIHGDFNTDNVLYNFNTKQVHFIDLHRSCDMDYIQDISVFLVSIFRLPVFGERIRERLNKTSVTFFRFARNYAHRNGDSVFDARLALGLIRSFITSTRFVLNGEFAKMMFLRANYLMERLIDYHLSMQEQGRSMESFELPVDVLIY